jgi:hypothetical protein
MLKLFGANPAVGVLIGIALLGFGLLTGRPLLAIAGGFVLVASLLRLLNRPGGGSQSDHDQSPARRGR